MSASDNERRKSRMREKKRKEINKKETNRCSSGGRWDRMQFVRS